MRGSRRGGEEIGQEEEEALVAAEEEYERTRRLDPEHVLASNNLALSLMRRGRLSHASSLLAHALSLAPSHPLLLSNSRLLSTHLRRKQEKEKRAVEEEETCK